MAEPKQTSWTRSFFNAVGILVAGIIALTFFAGGPNKAPAPVAASGRPATATPADDIAIFAAFDKKLAVQNRFFEAALKAYEREGKGAPVNQYAMYSSAKDFKAKLEAIQTEATSQLEAPTLSNAKASENALSARNAFLLRIQTKIRIADMTMEALDSGDVRPSKIDEVKDLQSKADQYTFIQSLSVMSTYEDLGIDFKKVDHKNGGLLAESKPKSAKPAHAQSK